MRPARWRDDTRIVLRAIAVLLLVVAAVTAAPTLYADPPRLEVRSASGALASPVSLTLDYRLPSGPQAAAASRLSIYAPAGYGARLDVAQGTRLGRVLSASLTIDGTPTTLSTGTLVAGDPAQPGVGCDPGGHRAVWMLGLRPASGPALFIPLLVDPVTAPPESAFASLRIQACLDEPVVELRALELEIDGVFTNPSAAGTYVWRGVFTPRTPGTTEPDERAAVESRSLLPLPVVLTLAASYDRAAGRAVVTGSLTAGGKPVAGQPISLWAGPSPYPKGASGTATTGAQGRFRATRTITASTYFRATASVPATDVSATACGLPVAPGGCASAVRSPFSAASRTVKVAAPPARTLRLGSRGADVARLQGMLIARRYLPAGTPRGRFDERTWHAVVAFQGWQGLPRNGVVAARTWRALAAASVPRPWGGLRSGLEIDTARQVLLLVRGGAVVRAIHVSTGAYGRTPIGRFAITAKSRLSWSVPFQVWMPYANYFHGGYAIHGYPDVPAYPASHGCVRVPLVEAPGVYGFTSIRMPVWIR
jgi:peptidoglycan hydrolase-like protein with peptidoglycan-binding domain